MKTILFLLLLTLSSCSSGTHKEIAKLQVSDGAIALDSAQAQAIFEHAQYFPNGTQLSICIITRNAEKFVGIERRNDSLVYIDNRDSVFEIGSITKTFTGTMLAKLVYDGKVNEDDPVRNHLPCVLHQSSLNGKEMTLVQLANHTSGMPFEPTNVRNDEGHPFDKYAPYKTYDTARLYDYLEHQLVLQSTPGEKRTYSNLGAGVLGHILTLIARKSYEEFLFETVCRPLGMSNTFVELTPDRERRMVHGRDPNGDVLPHGDGDCSALTGCGGIKSSARDLVKYLRANMSDTTYFSLAQKPTKQFDEHFSGALGWAPYSEGGKVHQGAFGATPGYTCGIIFERNERIGVIVLTNISSYLDTKGKNTETLCRALYDPLTYAVEKNKRIE